MQAALIVLLDEATANVDSENEKNLMNAVDALMDSDVGMDME